MNPPALLTWEQFVERWRVEVAGLALYGQYMHSGQVPMSECTKHALAIPKVTQDLLRRMYSSLVPAEQPVRESPASAPVPNRMPTPAANTNGAAPVRR